MHSPSGQATPQSGEILHERRGVKTRFIGVVLISLGLLNTLLTLRGGLPSEKYLILIGIGAAVFAIGAARSRRDSRREIDHDA